MNQQIVAYQGVPGAYSHLVAHQLFPNATALACPSFDAMFETVRSGKAAFALAPVENSVAGRVADMHHLLPDAGLFIQQEYFLKVNHCLLAAPGATLESIKEAHSHIQGLSQCREFLKERNIKPVYHPDTAGAAEDIAKANDITIAAIASSLAGKLYGLEILAHDIADEKHNTTRFLVMGRKHTVPDDQKNLVTTLVFEMRSVPAALYKALGGFATNGINLTKIESYMLDGKFQAAQFYVDAEGHQDSEPMQHALDELKFYSKNVQILGCYERSSLTQ